MLNSIIRFSLKHRPVVVALALIVLVYGSYTATTLSIDVFPDLDRPRVTLLTEATGLAPEEVETLVTFPIEAAMVGANGVRDVRTQSGASLSAVVVEFDWGTDIRIARQVVQERLATVQADLPEGVRPQMAPMTSILGRILVVGLRRQQGPNGGDLAPIPGTPYYGERTVAHGVPALSVWQPINRRRMQDWKPISASAVAWTKTIADGSQTATATLDGKPATILFPSELQRQMALRTLADWVVRPRLLRIPGVAQVIAMGGGRKQYQVLVDPTALTEYGVTLADVDAALRANNVNTTGGFSVLGGVEKPVRVLGRLGPRPEQVIEDLRKLPLKANDQRTILLEQVARIAEGPQLARGDAAINGVPGVAVTITRQPHMDTRALSDQIQADLVALEPTLPADILIDRDLYQLRDFIDRGVSNVAEALAIGALLVLVVLFLFLMNVRTTMISLTAIPLSLAVTALVFELIGSVTGVALSINVMTLGGLAVAMGELVDDAIVDVENIYRRLRENAQSPLPRPALRVVYEASAEVRTSIVFGTAVVILVFVPLFALSGIEGRLFTPLGIAYIVSILASLAVSLTVTPVLSYYLLSKSRAVHRGDGPLLRLLKWLAAPLVRLSMRRVNVLMLLTWLAVAYCGWRITTIGADFLPPFDEGTAQLTVQLPAGSSLEATVETGRWIDAKLLSLTASPANPTAPLRSFVRKSGRAEQDEHADPPNVSDIILQMNPESGLNRAEALALIHKEVKEEAPGVDVEIEQPLAHLISETIAGSTAQIAIKVIGDDLDVVLAQAQRIKAVIEPIPGVGSLVIEPIRKVDEVHIRLRPDDLAYYGIDRASVGRFVQTALQGEVVSQVVEGQRRFDLLVRLEEPFRADIARLGELRLELPNRKGQVRLSDVADITPLTGGDAGANQIKRENLRRRIIVRCNAVGRDLGSVVGDIERTVAEMGPLPEGVQVEYGGQFESQRRATRLIAILAGVSLVGMFGVLWLLFPSAKLVLQILNAVPTAFVGGVIALLVTGQPLTVASLVGFISLGGIAVRNGILLVTHYIHLMKHESEGFTQQMILRGSLERLAPVLMTALTAGIGLLPLVLAGQQPGREILYPVATVILGGLITSTFCEFLLHPGLVWRYSGADAERLAKREDEGDGFTNPEPVRSRIDNDGSVSF